MAALVFKWLFIPFIPLAGLAGTGSPAPALHPFHVSVVEINHNADDKTFEISCKIFTDDLEKVLTRNHKRPIDLINPGDRKATDKLVGDYIMKHLTVGADGKGLALNYLGYEREDDVIYTYLEVSGVAAPRKVRVQNQILYDLYTDQTNIVHVIVGESRKSSKLEYPSRELELSW